MKKALFFFLITIVGCKQTYPSQLDVISEVINISQDSLKFLFYNLPSPQDFEQGLPLEPRKDIVFQNKTIELHKSVISNLLKTNCVIENDENQKLEINFDELSIIDKGRNFSVVDLDTIASMNKYKSKLELNGIFGILSIYKPAFFNCSNKKYVACGLNYNKQAYCYLFDVTDGDNELVKKQVFQLL